jgi:hypothetical protein
MIDNSAIVYLLRSTNSDVNDIINSLNTLFEYFIQYYNYPVIIFVEEDFLESYKNKINENINFTVSYELIKFKTHEEINDERVEKVLITHNGTQKWPLGYRSMCRFWTGDFVNNDIIKKYRYIWRMDSDAFLKNAIEYDVFENMSTNNIGYSYSNVCEDEEEVCLGLKDFCEKYFTEKNISFQWDSYKMFTTHVEIIDTEILKNTIYYDLYTKIDETNNFYIHRWGDAPIRYIVVTNLNIPSSKLNIDYIHGNDGSGRREQLINTGVNL